jgi:DNA recombination protein RmuC
MPELGSYVILAALVVVVALVALALGKLSVLAAKSDDFERDVKQDLANARREQAAAAKDVREELGGALARQAQAVAQQLNGMAGTQSEQLKQFGERLGELTKSNETRLEAVRATVEQKLETLRSDNAQKLEQMRATVDEKLQTTLDQRLGASFKQVSERLEQVHQGLGDMRNLAAGVGDLKRVLTNVKTRGTWGEVQLAAILSEVLTPQQYGTNVETIPGTGKRVEFAIRLPGRGDDGKPCWLPIDAKFPLDDWQRLQDALERADAPAADLARKSLADFLRAQAKTIHELYVAPPHTTDFAILFVPTEGLYAEMMSRPGYAEALQREFRVTLVGPTNFMALLNSLQMGFRTLAIEQRSSEVWKVLGAVKSEFGKFGDVLAKTKDRIDKAGEELERAGVRSRAIARELRNVEALPALEAERLIDTTFDADEAGLTAPDAGFRTRDQGDNG